MTSLRVTNGPAAGQEVKVEGDLVIGREQADLTLDDQELSRRHAVVRPSGDGLEIEDLSSSNGTFVDGRRIEAPTKLGNGDKIKLGTTVLEVEAPVQQTKLSPTQGEEPVADPQSTKVSPVADPQATKATPVAQAADPAPVADPQATKATPIADPQATKSRPIADPEATRARRAKIAEQGPSPTAAKPAPAAPAAPGAPKPGGGLPAPIGTFAPPARRRSRGLASRSWVPTTVSFGTALAVLAALIIYFAVRGV